MVHERRRLRFLRPRRAPTTALVTVLLLAAACSPGAEEAVESTAAPPATQLPDDTSAAAPAPTTEVRPAVAPTTQAPPDTAPRRGGTLRVLMAADPTPITGWTPWDHVCAWSCRNVLDHVLETLTVILPDGSVAPWLAESVSADASLQRWTVTLRPDITFTDGEPMDALTIKTGVDDYLRSGRASGGHLRDARIASVIVADELRLIFELSEPNAGLPAALAGPVGRVFSIAAAEADPDIFARGPVGTGAFFFRRWSAGEPAVLEANPDYWRTAADGSPLPWAAEIQFTEIPDERERLAVLLGGGGDILMSRSAELSTAAAVATDGGGRPLNVIGRFDDNAGVVLFNLLRAPLDDIRVRRALIAAADQTELLEALGPDVERLAATQWWAPGSIWHSAEVAEAWPGHDLQRAQSLLREYTEDPERSDDRDPGAPVRIRVLCTDDLALAQMTATLERQWEDTGLVDVDVETVARTGLISRVMGSVVQSPSFAGDFGATCWRVGGESDPAVLASAAVGPVRTTPLNVSNFTGEHLAALASLIKATDAGDDRRQAVAQFMLELTNEAPYVYLGYASSVVAATADVAGLGTTTLPDGSVVEGQRLGVGRYDGVWLRRE
ncbi:ABC transporter substrate-binding protein [Candidatus Poriferisodalis sp.]|uniref:ABC transporter substrate-binding protein n=1 Tax=Candidatus Poriferisodalis sp. TaxID=3101277 RepID=UPI003B58F5CF